MGCRGAAQPVYGKLRVGIRRVARHVRTRRQRRTAAAGIVRQNARRQKLPTRHVPRAPNGIRLVRYADYSETDPARLAGWAQVLDSVCREVAVVQPPAYNRFANSFGQIFAGGYSAGYYSYAWAEVLSADAYAAFEESGDVAECGRRFWQEILAVGGSRSAAESFQAFRGREPSIDALLSHSGFDNAA